MAKKELILALKDAGLFIATAESLTAGMLSEHLTFTPGSSEVFLGGVVAYQSAVKSELLGVSPALLENQGAVDAEVAAQMAAGVRERFAKINQKPLNQVLGVSLTGVAGPGLSNGKPAGTVFIGVSSIAGESVYAHEFRGNREQVRERSVEAALAALWEQLEVIVGY